MADVEQAPIVEQQVEQEGEAPAAAPAAPVDESYDESLLIKVKGKVKRPQRPDDTERNAQVQKLQEAIDKASSRMKEIKAILDARASGGRTASPEQQAIRDKLAGLRQEWDKLLLQKKRLQTQQDDHKTERDKLFAEQRAIKDTIRGPSNLQAVEAKLQELEFKLTHESLSAAQEKSLREQKERMERQDKPAVQRLAQVSAKIDECKAANEAIRGEIAILNVQLDKIKADREAEDAKLQQLRAAEQEARSDIPALNVEKKELWEIIQTLRDKQREIRNAFNEQWEEFKKQDKAWKGWFAQERKKRQEQRKQEYEERQAARKARDQEHKIPKFEQEVYTCEQVLSYLRQFVSAEKASNVAEKKELEAPAPGMKLLAKKDDFTEDTLFAGMGGKKGKGARKAAEKQQKAADSVKKLPQVLPLETLKTFMQLGLETPKNNEEVPKSIEAVEAKKREFEEKRDKAAAEPSEEEEVEEPAEDEPEEAAAQEEGDAAAEEEAKADEEAEAKADEEQEAKADEEQEAKADEEQEAKADEEQEAKADAEEAKPVADDEEEAKPEADDEEEAKPEANGNAEEPKAEANGDTVVEPGMVARAVAKAEANGNIAEANGNAAEANGDAAEANGNTAAAGGVSTKADDGLGVKLRVTDDGEVNLELAV